MNWPPAQTSIGALVAIVVLVVAIVLMVLRGPSVELGMFAALAVARLT